MTPSILVRAFVATLTINLTVGAGCEAEDRLPQIDTEIPFRADGIVEFFRSDSSLVTRIAVEIAEGHAERARGLMHRRQLSSRTGMLFIDEKPDTQRFWMENTPIPLDMIFVDESGRVVNVERAHPFSRETVQSAAPALYNIEVRAGFAARHGIDEKTFVRWHRLEEGAGP